MQVFSSREAILIQGDGSVLQCCKRTATLSVHRGVAVSGDAVPVGQIVAVLGRLSVEDQHYLLVVTRVSTVGHADIQQTRPILRVDQVKALRIVDDGAITAYDLGSASNGEGAPSEPATTSKLKSGFMKFVSEKLGNAQAPTPLIDEVLRLFNDQPDFYLCFEHDLTLNNQRFHSKWPTDVRFFWNRHLLEDLFMPTVDEELAKLWIVPVIQGHVSSRKVKLEDAELELVLISRRSVKRAGCRYLRRGIDEEAQVANYVETELVVKSVEHVLSFVQARGSVPLYWSQKGIRYRPPLTIDRPIEESLPVFIRHFEELQDNFMGQVIAVSLVNQAGRELCLATAFLEHMLKAELPYASLYFFDFHYHCRALKFNKVQDLIGSLADRLAEIGYCWVDKTGEMVRTQNGVVRTNCVDCLDRTNVVQGAISQHQCMQQASKLGLIGPFADPPEALVQALQEMWADNGDSISRQYAGTAALKGDVTRSGERKLTGIVRDGMNSANRYYLSQVRDASRQRAINAVLGVVEEVREEAEEEEDDEDENVCRLVKETIRFLLADSEVLVGGWALVDVNSPSDTMDSVLLLTRTSVHLAVYDDSFEKFEDIRVACLEDIVKMELAPTSKSQRLHFRVWIRPAAGPNSTTSSSSSATAMFCLRAASTRLFNNVAIRLKTGEEADEYLQSISEQFSVAYEMLRGAPLVVDTPNRLANTSQPLTGKALVNKVSSVFRNKMMPKRSTPTRTSPSRRAGAGSSPREQPKPTLSSLPPVDFRDDFNEEFFSIEGSDSLPIPVVQTSASDGKLSERALQSSGLVSRLQSKFRKDAPTPPQQPFASYQEAIAKAQSKIVLL